jgi:hypothetical protein
MHRRATNEVCDQPNQVLKKILGCDLFYLHAATMLQDSEVNAAGFQGSLHKKYTWNFFM